MKAAGKFSLLFRLMVAVSLVVVTHLLEVNVESRLTLWSDILNAGHVVLLGAFSLVVLGVSSDAWAGRFSDRLNHYAIAFSVAVGIGAFSELLQIPGPRNADALDVARDAAGAFCFLGLNMTRDRSLAPLWQRWGRWARPTLITLIVLVLGTSWWPALQWVRAFHHRNTIFPVLCTFDSRWEEPFWTTRNARLQATVPPVGWPMFPPDGEVGRVVFTPSNRSGFALNRVFPDWAAFRSLQLNAFLDSERPVVFVIQVEDAHFSGATGDRYTFEAAIKPGFNRVVVPLDADRPLPSSRLLDLQRIAKAYFLTKDTTQP